MGNANGLTHQLLDQKELSETLSTRLIEEDVPLHLLSEVYELKTANASSPIAIIAFWKNPYHPLHCNMKILVVKHGLDYDDALFFEGDFNMQSGIVSLPYFIKQNVTAIFSANDMMAYGLCYAAFKHGITVPDELSVIGFDNNQINDMSYPPLTTISQDLTNMCLDTVSYLLTEETKADEQKSLVKLYEPKLVIRSSTAPPEL